MARRYYSAAPLDRPEITLEGGEAHHLLHVLRAKPGAEVVLFDGAGGECDAAVVRCDRSTVTLAPGPRRQLDREPPAPLVLGVALPKGDRQRWLVEKSVELGVTQLVPLRTEHSTEHGARPGAKLERYVVEASKQCGRNRLMAIAELHDWDQWLALPGGDPTLAHARRLVAHPSGASLAGIDLAATRATLAAVGPEGGFTDGEIAAAEAAGWTAVSLGPRLLRVETAALALAASVARWPG